MSNKKYFISFLILIFILSGCRKKENIKYIPIEEKDQKEETQTKTNRLNSSSEKNNNQTNKNSNQTSKDKTIEELLNELQKKKEKNLDLEDNSKDSGDDLIMDDDFDKDINIEDKENIGEEDIDNL